MNDHDEQSTAGQTEPPAEGTEAVAEQSGSRGDQTSTGGEQPSTAGEPSGSSSGRSGSGVAQQPGSGGEQADTHIGEHPTESFPVQQPTLEAPWTREELRSAPSPYRAEPYGGASVPPRNDDSPTVERVSSARIGSPIPSGPQPSVAQAPAAQSSAARLEPTSQSAQPTAVQNSHLGQPSVAQSPAARTAPASPPPAAQHPSAAPHLPPTRSQFGPSLTSPDSSGHSSQSYAPGASDSLAYPSAPTYHGPGNVPGSASYQGLPNHQGPQSFERPLHPHSGTSHQTGPSYGPGPSSHDSQPLGHWQPAPQGPQGPQGSQGAAGPGTASASGARHRAKTPWLMIVSVAVVAALLSSVMTGLVFNRSNSSSQAQPPLTASTAQLGTQSDSSVEVPVASSTAANPDWQTVASAVAPSVVAIAISTSSGEGVGSGVIVDSKGLVLTNDHVVGDSAKVTVTLHDGTMYDAEIVGTDPTTDLAVVQLIDAPDGLRSAVFADSDTVAVGDPVMAVGNPLGLSNTATTGIVSALNRPVSTSSTDWTSSDTVVTNAIQIDAAINPGNSGGPLFNVAGEVIGITSSIATLSSSDSSSGSIGLGFAIPSNLADLIGSQLIESGTAQHAFLGVTLVDSNATADGQTRQGARVEQVVDGSPAKQAGLQTGDVVIAIDSQPVSGAESLTAHVRAKSQGTTVVLTIVRDGKALDTSVVLAAREDSSSTSSGDSQDEGSDRSDGSSDNGDSDSRQRGGSDEGEQDVPDTGDSSGDWPAPGFNPWGSDEG